ncbi:unnamed protein product [Hermetia illucens]|uniref:Uncharacterized protein n=1 Tax=Hermetia illucens TaxID=343691 RepID=A0A7R8V178_HERIL|nr:unnamed protein product [Hermetia illucens]
MGYRVVSIIVFGLLLHSWTNCNTQAQLLRNALFGSQRYQDGSASNANSGAFSRNVGIGNLGGISTSGTRSQSVTRENGGIEIDKSKSISKGVNIGNLGISSSLSSSKSYSTNGGLGGGLSHDVNVGKVGLETSLSTDNLRNGFGLKKDKNGGLTLDLGLLEFDLHKNKQNPVGGSQAQTNAGAFATGAGAQTNAQSQSQSNDRKFGLLDISSSRSRSKSNAVSQNGQTGAYADGLANAAQSGGRTQGLFGRFKRQDIVFPEELHTTERRHAAGFGGRNRGGGGGFKSPGFEQQSAANTQTQSERNKHGNFQNNAASSQGSNLAQDGSSGQLSSANTMQQNFQTAGQSGNKNSAQSQSLNFDKTNTDASSSNADTSHIIGHNSETFEANSGSMSHQQNQFGSASNSAQTNSKTINEKGIQGSQSSGQSQSIFTGPNGGNSASNSASNAQSSKGPGFSSSSASSSSSSFSNGRGGQTSSSSSSSSGTAGGRHHHVRSLRNFKANSTEVEIPNNGIALQYNAAGDAKYQNGSKEYQVQPRTFDIIFSAIAGLFAPTTTRIPPCVLYPCRPPMPPPCGSYPCGPPMRPPVMAPAPPPPVPVPMPPRYPCCAQCLQPCYRPYPYYPPIIIGGTYPPFFTTTAASFFGFGATTPNYNNIYVFPNGGPYYPFGYYRARNGRIWHSGNSSEVQHFSDSQKKNSER